MSATTFRSVSSAIFFAGALVVGSCNNDPGIMQAGGNGGGNAPTPPGGGNNGSGNNGKGGNGVPTPPGGGANGGATGTGAGGTTGGGMEKCTAVGAKAMKLPVDIYVLLDRSGSMLNDINDDGSMTMPPPTPGVPIKWDSMVEALTKFVNAPSAAGLQLGLGVFPRNNMCRRQNCCDAAGYATPVVPVTALPGGAMPFLAGVMGNAAAMGNGTPTLPALEGAIMYAQQRETMVGRRLAIALATDGMPNDCQMNRNSVAEVVNAAQMGAGLGVNTFVIGVGKQLMNLNQIAMAGGTKQAYLVEMATADQLAMAFKAVQNQAALLACSFMIPPPPAGMTLDPNKVNVQFTAPDPAMSFPVGQVTDRMACGPMGGWYYDNPTNPRTVNLCEASCMKANDAGGGSIEVLFGCAGTLIK
jgi:hypothetical protein